MRLILIVLLKNPFAVIFRSTCLKNDIFRDRGNFSIEFQFSFKMLVLSFFFTRNGLNAYYANKKKQYNYFKISQLFVRYRNQNNSILETNMQSEDESCNHKVGLRTNPYKYKLIAFDYITYFLYPIFYLMAAYLYSNLNIPLILSVY